MLLAWLASIIFICDVCILLRLYISTILFYRQRVCNGELQIV
jgi:hypothetical protein